ncbi:MAG: hypothetical protein K0R34_3366 [Herbinix sp.]|jgi:hypothetical protein|nr:hypothetical protein [Herbinix sp.]
MSREKYNRAIDQIKISENFHSETARKMKEALPMKKETTKYIMRTAFALASAAVIITAGVYMVNQSGTWNSAPSITIAEMELPTANGEVAARMRPLFVYQNKIYIRYSTAIATADGYTVREEDMLKLRGDYLGTTTGGIDEWSGDDAYIADFASNIGDAEVYTVKGYDSKYRLMVYTPYEGGFGCEIYDSFGGLIMNSGDDYFSLLNLKGSVISYQWETMDSWNNGGTQKTEQQADDGVNKFIKALYESTPVERSIDTLIDEASADSQKFLYLKTEDNLITSIRLLQDGYVYVDEIGFFQVDQADFDEFYSSLQ